MNIFRNQEEFLRVETYLGEQLELKGYSWNPDKMKILPSALYANKEVEFGGSTIDLLEGDSQSVRGITNFDTGRQLAKGRVFVANGVSFGHVVDDSGKPVHAVDYDYSTVPPYMRFANLVLKQKDEVVVKLPLFDVININGRGNDSFIKELGALAFIEDDSPVEFSIELPRGATAGLASGKSLYVSANLTGLETFLKR